jgi:antitoxin component YwqK of YwqJK toxin-antitoxin module
MKIEIIEGECDESCCDGRLIFYDEKGRKYAENTSRYGEFDGPAYQYFTDGKIRKEFTYQNDMKNGITYEYYHNGQIHAEGNYIDDKEDGEWTFRDTTGKIIGYAHYKNGIVLPTK